MTPTLIVHPTDLSEVSEGAYHHALKLALAARCRLARVHVHGYDAQETPDLDTFPQVRETLERWGLLPDGAPRSDVAEKLGLRVTKGEVLAMNPEQGLAKLLQKENAAMIVLGTRGLTGLQRLSDRSFSEHLARAAKIPTLFIPSGAEGFVDGADGSVHLKNILLPVTDDPDPTAAIVLARLVRGLLKEDSQLHVLHVGSAETMPAIGALHGLGAKEIIRQGHVEDTIVRVAEEIDADLIVMATAGHKGILDALRGSSTEAVLRKWRRPLLAVPAGDGASG
jgi:nucleotide-binding universal stress UspA family protein